MNRSVRRLGWMRLALVLAVGAAVRLIALFALRDDLMLRVPLSDAEYYLSVAAALAEGRGWPAGPHFMGPVYPWLLSGLFRLSTSSTEVVQWAQLCLGLATTALVYLSASRIDRRAALPAGFLYALCGPAIFFENLILMESLLAFLLAAGIFLGAAEGRQARWLIGGAALAFGLATAGRPIYLLLLPVLLFLHRRRNPTPLSRDLAVATILIGFLLAIVPPSLHSSVAVGRPVFVTVSGGLNLYIGNHPGATGRYTPPSDLRFLEQDPTGISAASALAGRPLDAEEASRLFATKATRFLREQPADALQLLARKARSLVSPVEIPQVESFGDAKSRYPILRFYALIGFALLLPLGLLGMRNNPEAGRTRRLAIAVLLVSALVHLVFFSTARYRAPFLPALAILAGPGLVAVFDRLRHPGRGIGQLWPLSIGLLLLLIAPRFDSSEARVWGDYQAGVRYMRLGADRAAAEMFRSALAVDPEHGESWHNLGACAARAGRTAEGIQHYKKAIAALGDHPVTHYNLGILHGQIGMDEKALHHFDASLAADPSNPTVRIDRGVALFRLGRREEAFEGWRGVARLFPGHPALLATLGRFRAAGVDLPSDLLRLTEPSGR